MKTGSLKGIGDPKPEKVTKPQPLKKTFTKKEIKPLFSHFKGGTIEGKVIKASELPDKLEKPLKRTKVRSVSKKQGIRLKEYSQIKAMYLPNYPNCEFKECRELSNEVHHKAGKTGKLLFDERYFMAVCREHHIWIETHPKESKELGYSVTRLDK
jgi:hypothetical protein